MRKNNRVEMLKSSNVKRSGKGGKARNVRSIKLKEIKAGLG